MTLPTRRAPYIAKYSADEQKVFYSDTAPKSGTSGTFAGFAPNEAVLYANGVAFVNEGTYASPYWTPLGFDQRPLFGVHTDFRDQAGKAIADTNGEAVIPGSGLRVFGQGIAETDSGLVAQTATEGGIVGRLTATNEDAHVAAIGMDAGVMQPDQHQVLVVDVEFTNVSAITNRSVFAGFIGTAADALDPAVTGATTTLTLVQDDVAGLFMDAALTDADGIFAPHNKSNEAASIATTATGVDCSSTMPAAATYTRWRVEIDSAGVMTCFIDTAQVTSISASLDADEECSPVLYIESTTTTAQSLDVRHFSAWAYRA